tara:strand:- start:176 stop:1537 length:1362 start_codon:yes stop_codon:yes gene_type:complete
MDKIIVTVGPSTESTSNLNYILNKTKLIRLNLSHNTIDWHKKIIKKIKAIRKDAVILVDIPGIKPRTLNTLNTTIKKNQKVVFYYGKKPKNSKHLLIPLSNNIPKSKNLQNSNFFSVDDGNYKFRILEQNRNYILGKSIDDFVLEKSKGINIRRSVFNSKTQEKKYFDSLKIVSKLDINAVGLSYIQNPNTIKKIKSKFKKLIIISKVENLEGIINLDSICKASDVIMIDRGDLSAEIGEENLFESIIDINITSKKYGKPVIMATENLRSMTKRNTPDKSEIMSIGITKMLGIDSIMLSEETATSKNWKVVVNWLDNFNKKSKIKNNLLFESNEFNNPLFDKINSTQKTNIILFLKKGYLISEFKKIDPKKKIFVFSDNKLLLSHLEFYSNIFCYYVKKIDKKISQAFINREIKLNKNKIFEKCNQVMLIFTSFPVKGSKANTFSLLKKSNFN